MPLSRALVPAALIVAVSAPAALAAADVPETNKHDGPTKSAGYYLGEPMAGFPQWHGCSKYATAQTQAQRDPAYLPATVDKGNKQSAVHFTAGKGPLLSWTVAGGYTICGVTATVSMYVPGKGTDFLLGEVGYTSGATSGHTSKAAGNVESIKTQKLPKDSQPGFAGQKASLYEIFDVTVYVKRK